MRMLPASRASVALGPGDSPPLAFREPAGRPRGRPGRKEPGLKNSLTVPAPSGAAAVASARSCAPGASLIEGAPFADLCAAAAAAAARLAAVAGGRPRGRRGRSLCAARGLLSGRPRRLGDSLSTSELERASSPLRPLRNRKCDMSRAKG